MITSSEIGRITFPVSGHLKQAKTIQKLIAEDITEYAPTRDNSLQYKTNECINTKLHHSELPSGNAVIPAAQSTVNGSVLFVDIRNFTMFADQLHAGEVVEFLNTFFEQAYEPVRQQCGWVVRFLGDGMVAMFEPKAEQPDDHAERALKVALLIVLAADSFRNWIAQRFPERKFPQFAVGIGIHSGEVMICQMGGGTVIETTIIGDTVNIAARLQLMTKTLGWSIATSRSCANIAGDRFQLGRDSTVTMKGGAVQIQAIEIAGLNPCTSTNCNDSFFYDKLNQSLAVNTAIFELAREQTDSIQNHYSSAGSALETAPQDQPIELEGYRLLRKLGQGGMSEVFLAENLTTHTQQVLKLVPTTAIDIDNDDTLQRFLHEFALISQINHPNVARIYKQGFTSTHAYISMEFFPGGDLRHLISEQPTPQIAIASLLQIMGGLSAIHALGIIHCDMKPDNVMIRRDGSLALADFGIAEHSDVSKLSTRPGEIMGSPSYLAPEQALGLPVDERTDLYSMGAMFYEMLTGRPPYNGNSVQAILYQHVNLPVPVLPVGLERFQPILNRMMAKSAAARFESADAVVEYVISSGLIGNL
ncbi:Non-specific serine/threonine protein kinase [Candidatus Nitrotoga sp. HW29]|uniref:protein kinase domain-containing protein n=1 Tax=Candidatus Nitrotoga sp. HW29 TaxID=2886963 RepID=UPI001EF27A8E|nr:protein kinase [Candidatus Nitrotoga sp. HW29]CAH1903809.1 Non-specific serine/threonine protein kinase [Candidatus Nitrotoga sp. HW29]